jgi:hypothetical protein
MLNKLPTPSGVAGSRAKLLEFLSIYIYIQCEYLYMIEV